MELQVKPILARVITPMGRKVAVYMGWAIVGSCVIVGGKSGGWPAVLLLVVLLNLAYWLRDPEPRLRPRQLIDLLTLAIQAKDPTTHAHLERVEVYAIALGRELGLGPNELEALRASALLHDIGKLAVPEYIISKPGKLTPDEFQRMKTHTLVGEEIVQQIHLPYPAAPIVRSHHEKWDGTGYPDGLSGRQIPLGARILAAVDCLDALASDRHYRRALPLNEAIKIVEAEAGKAFDPTVVAILSRRYIELEHKSISSQSGGRTRLTRNLRVTCGGAPAAGFESAVGWDANRIDLMKLHYSLTGKHPLSSQDTLSTFLASIRRIVPCEVLAIYRKSAENLVLETLEGEDYRDFAAAEMPVGTGLSGWVAENARSILNGNPSVEPGFLAHPVKFKELRFALAVPLEARGCVLGVLSLYRAKCEPFTSEDLTTLLSMGPLTVTAFDPALEADLRPA